MGTAVDLLTHYQREGQSFLDQINNRDKTRLHHYIAKMKRSSKEW